MSAMSKSNKEHKEHAVSLAILEVIEKDGLTGVTHSKVSRKSGVSRAWIYEYVGKEKGALIESAADSIASYFARSKMKETPKTKADLEQRAKEGIEFLFESTELSPVVIKLYYRFRGTPNPIGNTIRKYEKQWLDGVAKAATDIIGLSSEQANLLAELMLTLRLGFAHRIATAGNSNDARENAKQIFGYIHSFLASTT